MWNKNLGDDYSANYIIINNKSYDIEVLARGTKEYCEKKATEFKTYGDILKSSDESQKLRTKIISRSLSPYNKRSKSSINIQSNIFKFEFLSKISIIMYLRSLVYMAKKSVTSTPTWASTRSSIMPFCK